MNADDKGAELVLALVLYALTVIAGFGNRAGRRHQTQHRARNGSLQNDRENGGQQDSHNQREGGGPEILPNDLADLALFRAQEDGADLIFFAQYGLIEVENVVVEGVNRFGRRRRIQQAACRLAVAGKSLPGFVYDVGVCNLGLELE